MTDTNNMTRSITKEGKHALLGLRVAMQSCVTQLDHEQRRFDDLGQSDPRWRAIGKLVPGAIAEVKAIMGVIDSLISKNSLSEAEFYSLQRRGQEVKSLMCAIRGEIKGCG